MRDLFMIFFISVILVGGQNKCPFKEKFITQDKINIFIQEHNKIRNEVALGKIRNSEGKFQSAMNMNYIQYNQVLADKAQDCADRCPKKNSDCRGIDLGSGVLVYEGDTWNGGFDWFPIKVMRGWMDDPKSFRQIVWGQVTKFGCGRIQSNIKSRLREVIVCFYDQKIKVSGPPYTYGPIQRKCTYGRQPGFLGLCKNGRHNFIHQSHQMIDLDGNVELRRSHKKTKKRNIGHKKHYRHKNTTNQTLEIQETEITS